MQWIYTFCHTNNHSKLYIEICENIVALLSYLPKFKMFIKIFSICKLSSIIIFKRNGDLKIQLFLFVYINLNNYYIRRNKTVFFMLMFFTVPECCAQVFGMHKGHRPRGGYWNVSLVPAPILSLYTISIGNKNCSWQKIDE